MKPVEIPQRVDEPPHLLMWSADELAPILVGLVLGVILNKVMICVAAGFLLMKLYRKFRDNYPDGFMLHILYWIGLPISKARVFINPYIRRLLP